MSVSPNQSIPALRPPPPSNHRGSNRRSTTAVMQSTITQVLRACFDRLSKCIITSEILIGPRWVYQTSWGYNFKKLSRNICSGCYWKRKIFPYLTKKTYLNNSILFQALNAELRVLLPEERSSTPTQAVKTAHVKPFVSPNSKTNGRPMGDVAAARGNWRSLSTSRYRIQ